MDSASRKRKAEMARQLLAHPDVAPKGCIEIGYMLHDFLLTGVADEGTGVDTGAGFGAFDLWVNVAGEEYLVTVKAQPARAANQTGDPKAPHP